jgi:hypothetical protein
MRTVAVHMVAGILLRWGYRFEKQVKRTVTDMRADMLTDMPLRDPRPMATVARCPDRSIRDSSVAGRDHNEGERDRERTPPCSLLSHLKFFIGSDSMLPPVVRARRARATYCQVQSVGTCTITFIVQQNPLPVAYSKRNMPVRSSLISMNF